MARKNSRNAGFAGCVVKHIDNATFCNDVRGFGRYASGSTLAKFAEKAAYDYTAGYPEKLAF